MEREKFEALVEEALADIPVQFKELLKNVVVMVERRPPRGRRLLGLYHGVPFKYRGPEYGNVPPTSSSSTNGRSSGCAGTTTRSVKR